MTVQNIIEYVIAFAMCYFSFVVLQRHYTRKMTWSEAIKEGGKHIGIGIVLTLGSPVGVFILIVAAAFIVLTLGNFL